MALDARKRQLKKEKRNKREKEKRKQRNRLSPSPLALVARNPDAPFIDCLIHEIAFTEGLGNLLVSRSLPGGRVIYVMFLIDLFCLGIKDVFARTCSRSDYDRTVGEIYGVGPIAILTPEEAKKLTVGAAEYGHRFGFRPPDDYANSLAIYHGIDASACPREFTFGKDGRPFYNAGPHDGTLFQKRVIETLERTAGPGNYNYLFVIQSAGFDDTIGNANRFSLLDADDGWEILDDEDEEKGEWIIGNPFPK